MVSPAILPVDLKSIAYSQKQLDAYFSEECTGKRLIIAQKHGKERLELRNAKDLSKWDTVRAFLWGKGPAGFKEVMHFCADRCLSHKDLRLMIRTYNGQHKGGKRVNEAVRQILKKHVCSPFVSAVEWQNIEVLKALKNMDWKEARAAFIDENDSDKGLFFGACKPGTLNAAMVDLLVEFISDKAPEEDRNIIYGAKDEKGRSAFFLLALNSTNLSPHVINLVLCALNERDIDGKTPLMTIFQDQYSILEMRSLLKLSPNLSIKDQQDRSAIFYSYGGFNSKARGQKNSLFVEVIQQLPKEDQATLLAPFFVYRNAEGHSEYQRLKKEKRLEQANLVMDMKRAFEWNDDGWKEDVHEI